MESERPNATIETYKLEEEEEDDDEEEQNNEILKRRISSHPLYGLLVEAHLDCLKVPSLFSFQLLPCVYCFQPQLTLICVEMY